ncbi:MAG TPA: endonuclease/exonuclease/phosphatase family protein [Solirubrobacterales bacterium]|nr:endonuclease/exonuclease/phosphatase family protein [Solirubrobacterales bacterium]
MTRNLYLGADLGPAIASTSTEGFIEANGGILRQVDATNFPVRAKGLAKEILSVEPDLVGMQEVALWRTAAPSLGPVFSGRPEATTVKYDFLQLLLAQLNRHGRHYRPVVAQDEFDFEAPADANGVPGDGPGGFGVLANAELNGRLTMRDVILARVGAGVRTSHPESGNFEHLLTVKVAGAKEVTIKRGWASVIADVRGSRFKFVDAHLESFDDPNVVPSIRALQAEELAARSGRPAASTGVRSRPTILLGDFNSDLKTVGNPGDGQAYRALIEAGFRERSTYEPLNCCIEESNFDLTGGSASEFDHKVDHIMTNAPQAVKLVSSGVTGRKQSHGYWDSDHAGLYSVLRLSR